MFFSGAVGTGLAGEEMTVAEPFSNAGYSAEMLGTWHLAGEEKYYPTGRGFDEAAFNEGHLPSWDSS